MHHGANTIIVRVFQVIAKCPSHCLLLNLPVLFIDSQAIVACILQQLHNNLALTLFQ